MTYLVEVTAYYESAWRWDEVKALLDYRAGRCLKDESRARPTLRNQLVANPRGLRSVFEPENRLQDVTVKKVAGRRSTLGLRRCACPEIQLVDPGPKPVTVKSSAVLSQRGFAPRPPLRPVAANRVALSAVFKRASRARISVATRICPSASLRPWSLNW